jgi:hypothetical protein
MTVTFVVEKNLANLVSEIREAIDDDSSDPRFIRTGCQGLSTSRRQESTLSLAPIGISSSAPREIVTIKT